MRGCKQGGLIFFAGKTRSVKRENEALRFPGEDGELGFLMRFGALRLEDFWILQGGGGGELLRNSNFALRFSRSWKTMFNEKKKKKKKQAFCKHTNYTRSTPEVLFIQSHYSSYGTGNHPLISEQKHRRKKITRARARHANFSSSSNWLS